MSNSLSVSDFALSNVAWSKSVRTSVRASDQVWKPVVEYATNFAQNQNFRMGITSFGYPVVSASADQYQSISANID